MAMPTAPDPARRTVALLRPEQSALARAVADAARLDLRAVHAAPGPGSRSDAAADLDPAEPFDDPRRALTEPDAEGGLVLLLARPAELDGVEPEQLVTLAKQRSMRVVTLEPLPASVRAAIRMEDAGLLEWVRPMPLLRRAPIFVAAEDALENFGPIRTAALAGRCSAAHGSLAARLFDAMHLLHSLLGVPESVDASVVAPLPAADDAGPPSLVRLRGDLTANIRTGGARAASLVLSDRAGRWFRGVTILGEAGCLRLDERGFEHVDPDGSLLDSTTEPPARPSDASVAAAAPFSAADSLAAALDRMLDPRLPTPPIAAAQEILAMCEAAVLSARTGQSESPRTVLDMARLGA